MRALMGLFCLVLQFDKMVSAIIGVHAFTVLGPQVGRRCPAQLQLVFADADGMPSILLQILVLQDMLLGMCPQGAQHMRSLWLHSEAPLGWVGSSLEV